MRDGSRTTCHEGGAPRIPARWKRYHAPRLPRDVTVVAIPLIGTTWYSRGARYWRLRVGLAVLLLAVCACYLALYALILWDDHKRNGYSPAFWITAGILMALTGVSVLNYALTRRKPLTRVNKIRNPFLRDVAGFLRVLIVLGLMLLTPGLYLVALFESVRPRPANEHAAKADLAAQLAALGHSGAQPSS